MIEWFLSLSKDVQMIIFISPFIVGTIIGIWWSSKLNKYINEH